MAKKMSKKISKKTIINKHTNPYFKKFLPVLIFVAILGAALFIAAQLTARQAVAPNAPESEPEASVCGANVVGKCGQAGGCSTGKMCTKGGIQEYVMGKPIYKYSCVINKSCSTTKICYKRSCINGSCIQKQVTVPSNTNCQIISSCNSNAECKPSPTPKKQCDPSVTLQKCNGNQPQVCNNYQWVNVGAACEFGCLGAGKCLACKPGTTRCEPGDYFSSEYVQKCNSQGKWQNIKKCDINCAESGGVAYCTNVAG